MSERQPRKVEARNAKGRIALFSDLADGSRAAEYGRRCVILVAGLAPRLVVRDADPAAAEEALERLAVGAAFL